MLKVEENRQNFAILVQSKFTSRTYPELDFGTDLLAKIFPEQRQRLATNFHRTKTELHRTGVDLASPGDGWKLEPAQKICTETDAVDCRMGAVIPARKRVAVGQFLGQGGYLPEWLTPLKSPVNSTGSPSIRRVRRVAGKFSCAPSRCKSNWG